MPRVGEKYNIGEITVEIVEVLPYTTFTGRREYLIGYRIQDGRFLSGVAHFTLHETENIKRKIIQIVEHYNAIKPILRRT